MKRTIIFKIFIAIILTGTVIAAVVLVLFPRREVYNYLYEQQDMEERSGWSSFEAELNYDCMVEKVTGELESDWQPLIPFSADLNDKLLRLRQFYQCCKWICGLGTLITVAGLILLKNQKWYECLKLGGCFIIGADVLIAAGTLAIRPLRLFVLNSQYNEFLGYDMTLVSTLPDRWALYMEIAGTGLILLAGIFFLLLHFFSRRSYRPHKF